MRQPRRPLCFAPEHKRRHQLVLSDWLKAFKTEALGPNYSISQGFPEAISPTAACVGIESSIEFSDDAN